MILHRGDPGTKQVRYLEENLPALDVSLTDEEMRRIDQVTPKPPFLQ